MRRFDSCQGRHHGEHHKRPRPQRRGLLRTTDDRGSRSASAGTAAPRTHTDQSYRSTLPINPADQPCRCETSTENAPLANNDHRSEQTIEGLTYRDEHTTFVEAAPRKHLAEASQTI
jgi:hypothetical protein